MAVQQYLQKKIVQRVLQLHMKLAGHLTSAVM
jgi:hypothetical protein